MTDADEPPDPERLRALLETGENEQTAACLDRLEAAPAETRKRSLRAARERAVECPASFEGVAPALASFLTDDDRAIRLTVAKTFVALAEATPATVVPVVDALAERLADDAEFYYVRGRCAEALGYVAVESPAAVTDPETLADLRVGLSFAEPEVKTKLAKALSYVAVGAPDRLGHHVPTLATHLDEEAELVRYHLCTALVALCRACPTDGVAATAALVERLDDEDHYVRGRAAEALGVLAAADVDLKRRPDLDRAVPDAEPPAFLTDRVRFCREQLGDTNETTAWTAVGTIDSIRDGTDDVVAEMRTPDERTCPHCGLTQPDNGPPTCPRCGTVR